MSSTQRRQHLNICMLNLRRPTNARRSAVAVALLAFRLGRRRTREGLCRCRRRGRRGRSSRSDAVGQGSTLLAEHADNRVVVSLTRLVHAQQDRRRLHQLNLLMLRQQKLGSTLPVLGVEPTVLPKAIGVLVDLTTVHALVNIRVIAILRLFLIGTSVLCLTTRKAVGSPPTSGVRLDLAIIIVIVVIFVHCHRLLLRPTCCWSL